jgi:hypothetical protein
VKLVRSILRFLAVSLLSTTLLLVVLDRTVFTATTWTGAADQTGLYTGLAEQAGRGPTGSGTGGQAVAGPTSGAIRSEVELYSLELERYIRKGGELPTLDSLLNASGSLPTPDSAGLAVSSSGVSRVNAPSSTIVAKTPNTDSPQGGSPQLSVQDPLSVLRFLLSRELTLGLVSGLLLGLVFVFGQRGRRMRGLAAALFWSAVSLAIGYGTLYLAPSMIIDRLKTVADAAPILPLFRRFLVAVFQAPMNQLLVLTIVLAVLALACLASGILSRLLGNRKETHDGSSDTLPVQSQNGIINTD